jgi:hypothetical protein
MLTPGISPMAFALNNPVSFNDPTGLYAIDGGGAVCTNCVEEGSSASAPSDGQESVAQGPKAPQKQQNNKNDDFFFLQNQFGLEKNWGNHRRNTPPYAPYEALNQGFSKKILFLDEVVINGEREEEINDDSPFLDILKKIRSPHKDLHKPLKNKVKSHGEDVVDIIGTATGWYLFTSAIFGTVVGGYSLKSMQVGLSFPSKVDFFKKAFLSTTEPYDFLQKENKIGGYIYQGHYVINEGNHRMSAAIEIYRETGNAIPLESLIRNGNWYSTSTKPSAELYSMPGRDIWTKFRSLWYSWF